VARLKIQIDLHMPDTTLIAPEIVSSRTGGRAGRFLRVRAPDPWTGSGKLDGIDEGYKTAEEDAATAAVGVALVVTDGFPRRAPTRGRPRATTGLTTGAAAANPARTVAKEVSRITIRE
jgi:hypothetical protein